MRFKTKPQKHEVKKHELPKKDVHISKVKKKTSDSGCNTGLHSRFGWSCSPENWRCNPV